MTLLIYQIEQHPLDLSYPAHNVNLSDMAHTPDLIYRTHPLFLSDTTLSLDLSFDHTNYILMI